MGVKDQLIVDSTASSARSLTSCLSLSAVKCWCRTASGHVGLLTALIIYTVLGGTIFRNLEYPSEVSRLTELERLVRAERSKLLTALAASNNSLATAEAVNQYEAAVQAAAQGGLLLPLSQGAPPYTLARWSYLQAIFFASTVLTTIGYGNITPYTVEGRLFCIMFALVGIPLTVSVMADLGSLLAGSLPEFPEPRGLQGSLTTAAIATSILLIYIAVGSFLFISWEEDWSFFEGFYFCFVTMTTIGFGDLVPSTPQYMLLCTFYILIGLSLTSTIVEVVRQQYSQSWRHLQALVETLSHLATEHNPADMQADLRNVLAVVNINQDKNPKGWEQTVKQLSDKLNEQRGKPKVVQIIVYESSV
ncbi:potassium channel subfamily K member 6 [Homalodisca vitripennis]|uniref:potassium channel subfamily K member 6 n=1 Tax=Homalodisca vitripennis TaxID=197043 RepID=UPI001EEB77C5|nr:potassium channel subfamily K member 6 [Homalodisca vitripennis]XP_046674309.1 potassium channel subfamily K member 6 [Homalodisca vitripennis]